jgi:hypothetical protein
VKFSRNKLVVCVLYGCSPSAIFNVFYNFSLKNKKQNIMLTDDHPVGPIPLISISVDTNGTYDGNNSWAIATHKIVEQNVNPGRSSIIFLFFLLVISERFIDRVGKWMVGILEVC